MKSPEELSVRATDMAWAFEKGLRAGIVLAFKDVTGKEPREYTVNKLVRYWQEDNHAAD